MDDSREPGDGGNVELATKCSLLFLEARCGSRKVEPDFSHGDGRQVFDHSLQPAYENRIELCSQLRVQAKHYVDVRMLFAQGARRLPPVGRVTDIDETAAT